MTTASAKRAAAWALLLGGLGGALSCGAKRHELVTSSLVLAAEGKVSARVGDNLNTNLEVEVKHLAPPGRVVQGARVYVVWVRPASGTVQNVGALRLNENLEGKFTTVTPFREFTLWVTPETAATVQAPTSDPVMQAQIVVE
jgi:hypothetical protein